MKLVDRTEWYRVKAAKVQDRSQWNGPNLAVYRDDLEAVLSVLRGTGRDVAIYDTVLTPECVFADFEDLIEHRGRRIRDLQISTEAINVSFARSVWHGVSVHFVEGQERDKIAFVQIVDRLERCRRFLPGLIAPDGTMQIGLLIVLVLCVGLGVYLNSWSGYAIAIGLGLILARSVVDLTNDAFRGKFLKLSLRKRHDSFWSRHEDAIAAAFIRFLFTAFGAVLGAIGMAIWNHVVSNR